MASPLHAHLLWVSVAWPLLLAFPYHRIRDSWSRYVAIFPAALLAIWPGHASLALPQFVLGTGLAVESRTHWILTMSVTVWLAAAIFQERRCNAGARRHGRTLFLLSFAGNIGTVLSADIVGFFVFSVLMGYSFYGLYVSTGDPGAQRAGAPQGVPAGAR